MTNLPWQVLKSREVEREFTSEDGKTEVTKSQIVKFPCARDFISFRLTDRIEEKDYLESDFEHFKFVKDFEAIWSPKLNVIECELQPVARFVAPSHYLLRRLFQAFNEEGEEFEEQSRYEFEDSEEGIKVNIGGASLDYAIQRRSKDRRPRFASRGLRPPISLERLALSRHDQAKRILEKVGNSVLFKLDMTLNIGLKLGAEDRRH